jgi:hypothetical protein
MAYNQKDNTAKVFRNDRKREGKQDPDFTGSAVINGEAFWVDMWTKPPKDDKKGFFSVSFRPKDARPERPVTGGPASSAGRESARRHMPPPPLHQPAQPERKLDPVDEDGNRIF